MLPSNCSFHTPAAQSLRRKEVALVLKAMYNDDLLSRMRSSLHGAARRTRPRALGCLLRLRRPCVRPRRPSLTSYRRTSSTSETSQFREITVCWLRARRLLFRATGTGIPIWVYRYACPRFTALLCPFIHCVPVPVPVLRLAQHKGLLEDRAKASCLISTCMG